MPRYAVDEYLDEVMRLPSDAGDEAEIASEVMISGTFHIVVGFLMG